MAIDKHEMEKYIFDPDNPKQCKSYNLLLRIAKRDNATFISPDFLQYFFKEQIFTQDFDDEIWDKPNNYSQLTYFEKIKLYKELLSPEDFKSFLSKHLYTMNGKIFNYSFINKLLVFGIETFKSKEIKEVPFLKEEEVYPGDRTIISPLVGNNQKKSIKKYGTKEKVTTTTNSRGIFVNIPKDEYLNNEFFNTNLEINDIIETIGTDDEQCCSEYPIGEKEFNNSYIFLSRNYFDVLGFTVKKASIFITLEENMDEFFLYDQSNVKPIFLKKIEDVDRLLNILQQEINEEKFSDKGQEEIPTIDSINIKNFFSMEHIGLDNLKDKREVYIVGENGDGKTLLLQAIAIGMVGVNEGDVFNLTKTQKKAIIEIVDSTGNVYDKVSNPFDYLFAYGASRYNSCQMKEDQTGYLTLFENRYDLRSPVEWLQYLDHSEKSGKENIVSVTDAKKLLNRLLNRDVEIDVTPDSVLFKEKGAEVNFDQLSAGYKGVITIICDLIARLHEKQPYITNIEDFQGVVLIDEVELHLHPKWKYNFMKKLRDTFPLVQFIVTTHSPTVLLGASKEAVFYKIYKDEGKVSISNQIANEGYTNNTLISSPLFDLETITSRGYDYLVSSDDYIYDKIHKVVAQKIKDNVNVDEEELLQIIDEELDKV